jgi:hypothetical protein
MIVIIRIWPRNGPQIQLRIDLIIEEWESWLMVGM